MKAAAVETASGMTTATMHPAHRSTVETTHARSAAIKRRHGVIVKSAANRHRP